MKRIEAIIRPHKLDEVRAALDRIGVTGITIDHVRGSGRQKGHVEHYRGNEVRVDLLEKLRLVVVVPDHRLEVTVQAICTAARTGEIGDGKIFVSHLEDAIRIRTGERGDEAV